MRTISYRGDLTKRFDDCDVFLKDRLVAKRLVREAAVSGFPDISVEHEVGADFFGLRVKPPCLLEG